jgi:hypothetical protein
MTIIEFKHDKLSETYMKVVFDSNRLLEWKKKEWNEFKKIIDDYLSKLDEEKE